MKYDRELRINNRVLSINSPSYFIADIGANHDGDVERAKDLIHLAKEAGAHAAKFQHFLAKDIVSDLGFRSLKMQMSHQAKWDKSVYEIYEQYECSRDWIQALVDTCILAEIDFMTTPYDFAAIGLFADHVVAYKIGSGDITWIDSIAEIAKVGKPVFLASGAADLDDVKRAVGTVLKHNSQLCLLQCNTNYTGDLENFRFINLNVLSSYAGMYPGMVLGLSDHTPGHATVLGAIALGARVVEKHFTDDNSRIGPDHSFAMTPATWRDMVDRARELEYALGDGTKRIEENERETVIVQRRCVRLKEHLPSGTVLLSSHLEVLRPAPEDSIPPYRLNEFLGRTLTIDKQRGDALRETDVK